MTDEPTLGAGPVRILTDPSIMAGEPCFAGTRIPVDVVLVHLSGGYTEAEIHDAYPTLPAGSVAAARGWAAANGVPTPDRVRDRANEITERLAMNRRLEALRRARRTAAE
jgi:uncharacterized protein (DUF433 family)